MSLPYHPAHIVLLCSRLDLGAPETRLRRVYGGFHHEMWRLDTERGTYAVKQLCEDTDVLNPLTVRHYNSTESIAQAFAGHGIPAIYALKSSADYLHVIQNSGYLVYPWTSGAALEKDQITERHALVIARVIARMHRADIDIQECRDAQYDVHPEDKIRILVQEAAASELPSAPELRERLPEFLSILASLRAAIPNLRQRRVISHGDLDHKNVLWDAVGAPAIIDWESARKLNPTHEIVLEALDWSGITANFQQALFEKMLCAYADAGGIILPDSVEAAFHCVMGDWLNWLMYNLGRSLYLDDGGLGAQQVELALTTISRLQRLMPELLPIAMEV